MINGEHKAKQVTCPAPYGGAWVCELSAERSLMIRDHCPSIGVGSGKLIGKREYA
jgi:hypothetical protein